MENDTIRETMKQKQKSKPIWKYKTAAALSCLLMGLTIGIVLMGQFQETVYTDFKERTHWTVRAENPVTAGKSGFLMMAFVPHQDDGATLVSNNTFSGTLANYSWSTRLNQSASGELPYGTKFDICFKVRVNASDGQNSTSKYWNADWWRANITCAAFSLSAATMTEGNITAKTGTYCWVCFYVNGSAGSWGYTISKGQQINISLWKFEVYR